MGGPSHGIEERFAGVFLPAEAGQVDADRAEESVAVEDGHCKAGGSALVGFGVPLLTELSEGGGQGWAGGDFLPVRAGEALVRDQFVQFLGRREGSEDAAGDRLPHEGVLTIKTVGVDLHDLLPSGASKDAAGPLGEGGQDHALVELRRQLYQGLEDLGREGAHGVAVAEKAATSLPSR